MKFFLCLVAVFLVFSCSFASDSIPVMASRSLPEACDLKSIYLTSTEHPDIGCAVTASGGNGHASHVYAVGFDGQNLDMLASMENYKHGEDSTYATYLCQQAPKGPYFYLAGYYSGKVGSSWKNHPILLKLKYTSSGISKPAAPESLPNLELEGKMVIDADAGYFTSTKNAVALMLREYNQYDQKVISFYAKAGSSGYLYTFETEGGTFPDYDANKVKFGNFATYPGNETAVALSEIPSPSPDMLSIGKLYLFRLEGSTLSKISEKSLTTSTGKLVGVSSLANADIDSDGYDELIVSGRHCQKSTSPHSCTDAVLVYKYKATGWQLVGESLNSTGYKAVVSQAIDTDNDGDKEIVSLIRVSSKEYAATVFEFDPESVQMQKTSSKDLEIDESFWEFRSASIADYDGDGGYELAFSHRSANGPTLALYSLTQKPASIPIVILPTIPTVPSSTPSSRQVPIIPSHTVNQTNETDEEPVVEVEPAGEEQTVEAEQIAEEQPEQPTVEPEPSEQPEQEVAPQQEQAQEEQPPSEPAPVAEEGTAQEQADELIEELQIKIEVAQKQGIYTGEYAGSLEEAKQLQEQGDYMEAALEAQKAVSQLDTELESKGTLKPISSQGFYLPCPVTPVLIGALFVAFAASRKNRVV